MPTTIKVYIPLVGEPADALLELSQREFRNPRDQARKLILEGLCAAGALSSLPADHPLVHPQEPELAAR